MPLAAAHFIWGSRCSRRLGAVRRRVERGCARRGPPAAGVGRRDRRTTCLALVATLPERASPQRCGGGVRGDGRYRGGDRPGRGRGAHRGVVAPRVPGERADRVADDLPGPHQAAGDPEGADEARCRGAVLVTLFCTAAAFGLSTGRSRAGVGPHHRVGSVALPRLSRSSFVERTAENPIVPLSLFFDGNRLATFAAMFLLAGVIFTLTVVIAMYMQNIMGYRRFAQV